MLLYETGKHECDSETGFCSDKCPYTNGSYPYWRIRNAVDVPFLWVISGIKFYDTATSTKQLNTDPKRGYASSYFGPGECYRRFVKLYLCSSAIFTVANENHKLNMISSEFCI